MSDQPHNSGESGERAGQWLEEYARQRQRELNEPLELHEATRTMLHGEVRREYPSTESSTNEANATSAGWLWWGLTAGVGAVAILAALNLGSIKKNGQHMEMASATQPEDAGVAEDGEQADRSVAPSGNMMAEAKESTAPGMAEKPESPRPSVTPRTAHGVPGIAIARPEGGAGQAGEAGPVANPSPANARLRQSARYNNMTDMAQNFTQDRDAGRAKPDEKAKQLPTPVLVEFQVERTGNQVKVMDLDGSVYTGNVISEERFAAADKVAEAEAVDPTAGSAGPAAALGAAPGTLPVAPAPPRPVVAPSAPVRNASSVVIRPAEGQFFFRVKGTNRTLRQMIVFEATLDGVRGPASDWRVPGGAPAAFTVGNAPKKLVARKPNAVPNQPAVKSIRPAAQLQKRGNVQFLRVQGNARIGKSNFRVDAYQQSEIRADQVPQEKK